MAGLEAEEPGTAFRCPGVAGTQALELLPTAFQDAYW